MEGDCLGDRRPDTREQAVRQAAVELSAGVALDELSKFQLAGAGDRLIAAMDVELLVDSLQMGLDRARRDDERRRDLRPRTTGDEQAQHLLLAVAEGLDDGGRRTGDREGVGLSFSVPRPPPPAGNAASSRST